MQKKLFLIILLSQSLDIFTAAKCFKGTNKKQVTIANNPLTTVSDNKNSVLEMQQETQRSSVNFLQDIENESAITTQIVNNDHQVDWSTYAISDDLSDAEVKPLEAPQTWVTVLYEKYYRAMHEQCLIQRFCQQIGLKKKYTILHELLVEGQLTNYIDELNKKNISTGDSLLNEALCQAIIDDQRDIVIKLLSETLEYSDRLSKETKQRIDSFLEQDNSDKQKNISKEVSEYLERVRLTTQIRHTLNGVTYQGPNFIAITASASAHIRALTDNVVNNTLPIEKRENK